MLVTDINMVLPMVMNRVQGVFPTQDVVGIGWEQGGTVVAGVVYDHFTGPCIVASIAVDDPHMAREFLWAIFDYPFNQLGVGKILANVSADNEASLSMLKRMGFIREAYIEGVFPSGAMIIMSLVRENCVWLERLHHG
jgi:hypothetical protein